jgi:hypothetical protein
MVKEPVEVEQALVDDALVDCTLVHEDDRAAVFIEPEGVDTATVLLASRVLAGDEATPKSTSMLRSISPAAASPVRALFLATRRPARCRCGRAWAGWPLQLRAGFPYAACGAPVGSPWPSAGPGTRTAADGEAIASPIGNRPRWRERVLRWARHREVPSSQSRI